MMASQLFNIIVTREFPLRKFPENDSRATIKPGTYKVSFEKVGDEKWIVIADRGYGAPVDFWASWYERAWTQEGDEDILPQEER